MADSILRTRGLRRVFGDTGASGATGASDETGAGAAPGQTVALEGLDLDVASGELFGIVGPDGAGKTTTLRMLAGVLAPTGGDAWILGHSLVEDPERAKPHTAYMPQRFGLYEDLTVAENLDFYADLYRVPKDERAARLDRLYRFSRLDEFKDRLAGNLSGGMKQKLGLSAALIHQPKLLLLDEPTFGVDPISRRDLWLILHEMVDEGVTVVVSTSYLDEAERCDRVALLSEGRLLALDTPAGLVERAPGRIVEVKTARPRQDRDRLRAVDGIADALLFGDRIHVTLRDGVEWEQVAVRLASDRPDSGVQVLEARPAEASLEDVFLALVGQEVAA